ncbi:MAG: T9SS type A sorting domain-containing protein [Bacteroidia bacterium]|nr:T9SS type A sorting domain-containing protein [Bacteroidia bacterium]
MKKLSTIAALFLAFAVLPVLAGAQTFSVSAESANVSGKPNDYLSGYISVTNTTNQNLPLRVAITSKQNLPTDWQTQICFFLNCFPPAVESVEGVLQPNETDILDLTFMTGETQGTAVVQVTVTNMNNLSDFKVLTYTATASLSSSSPAPGSFSFALAQNYPNPFSSSKSSMTTIGYTLPNAGHAVMKIYNLLGKEIRTIVNESRPAGRSTAVWDGRDNTGRIVPAGVYMYKLSSGSQSFSRRLSLTR